MLKPRLDVTDAPSEKDLQAISGPLTTFNEHRTGVKRNFRPLAIFLRDPDSAEIVGGLWGMSYFDMMFVDLLYVPDSLRGLGLGTELIQRAEQEAAERGCLGVWLDTFDWQARPFYEVMGYTVFGALENHPKGHQRFFLVKYLQTPKADAS